MSVGGVLTVRSAFAPPPTKEEQALRDMPALEPPVALNTNIREVMQAAIASKPGQLVDKLA
jgi:hypothetical protein